MITFIIPAEKRLHKERHVHLCPICHKRNAETYFHEETNDICEKTLRGTGLDYHYFPCLRCTAAWRNHYGAETMIDGIISLEETARLTKIVPNAKADAREAMLAEDDLEMAEFEKVKKSVIKKNVIS